MDKKLLLLAGLIVLFTGCGGQGPDLKEDADKNKTEQNQTTPKELNATNVIVKQDNNKPDEADLADTTIIKVTEDSMNDENLSQEEEKINQNLAESLSKNVVHFDFDKYNIRNDQIEIVQNIANLIKDAKGNFTIRIEGNCDEWGSDEYNYALGLKRAKTLKQALIDLGVDANKLTIISYGESNPVCNAHNKNCWAKNRRDNFTLLP